MKWGVYIYVFFLAHIKFLFAASIAEATTSLSFVEILITTTAGALFCFNLFYFISKYFFFNNSASKTFFIFSKKKKKKNFKKRNRWIIKMKNSNGGFFLLCSLAPLFLSIPIGTFVVVKFYGKKKLTYPYVCLILLITAVLLAYLNHFIFH